MSSRGLGAAHIDVAGDEFLQLAHHLRVFEHGLAVLHAADLVEHRLGPHRDFCSADFAPVEAELLADDVRGERTADVVNAVGAALVRHAFDQIDDDLADPRFQVLDPVRGEGLLGQLAQARVPRRIDRQVADEAAAVTLHDLDEFGEVLAAVTVLIAVFEREGDIVLEHLDAVFVAGDEVEIETGVVIDRVLPPQRAVERKRIVAHRIVEPAFLAGAFECRVFVHCRSPL